MRAIVVMYVLGGAYGIRGLCRRYGIAGWECHTTAHKRTWDAVAVGPGANDAEALVPHFEGAIGACVIRVVVRVPDLVGRARQRGG